MKKILMWFLSKLVDNDQQKRESGDKKERKIIDPRHIKYRPGQRNGKVIFACIIWPTSFFIILFLGILLLSFLYGSLISLAVWIMLVTRTLKFFLVSVPKVSGLITTNLYDGYMESYETGVHFKYPWEQVENDHYLSMRLINEHYTKGFPTNDGPKVNLGWTIQYHPTIAGLPKYIAVEESKIKVGFGAVGNSYLSDRTAIKSAIEAREAVKELEFGLKLLFEKTPAQVREMDKKMFIRDIYISEKKLEGYSPEETGEMKEKIKKMTTNINDLDTDIKDLEDKTDSTSKNEFKEKTHERRKKERELEILERDHKKAQNGNNEGINKKIVDLEKEIGDILGNKPLKHELKEKREVLSILRNEKVLLYRAINKMESKLAHIEQNIAMYEEAKREQERHSVTEKLIDDSILEEIYGIDLRISSLDEVDYEPRYQKIRTTDQVSREMDMVTNRMIANSKDDDQPLTREVAYNNALIINNNATKDILETPGGAGEALASLLRSVGTFQQKTVSDNTSGEKKEVL